MESEMRKDLVVNRWVLISPRRSKRPHTSNRILDPKPQPSAEESCAFCYHHEHETGPELLAFKPDQCPVDAPCWRVRVVGNKYPAVSPLSAYSDPELCPGGEGLLKECSLPGFGAHEVVIETPDHNKKFASFSVEQIAEVLRAYQCRLATLGTDKRLKYCQIFKNHGNAAGASMTHSHSQIIALPIVTQAVEHEVQGAKAFYDKNNTCVFCEIIQYDLTKGKDRVIDTSQHFISLVPYAARFPYETWILPRRHNSNYASASDGEVKGLAEILKLTLMKMDEAFDYPPFNFMLQSAPLRDCDVAYYHWYLRIVPHLVSLGGFELGTGCHINSVTPESAAQLLRDIKIKEVLSIEDYVH